ncbi:calmodulin-binding transcription activator 5-like [Lycium ferocissimum]|uniref:calmodulin-binding transcription activator 5-like n=1 Tax=Lycium ferocissimum TaxID=112874 RepID=UPI002815E52E|nr:calmodulin-binding transcription activator 5-like [Lycium ferocissimum]
MESSRAGQLVGKDIHGFHTLQDLDIPSIMEEAKMRWFRPNEIHAILCNYKYFNIFVKPVNLPTSGTIVLFDRKMLRNFRKDGHNWKKKKDGKTVKEAHEHLKVGNDERIHVYYAHGEDRPTFVRRCYWLLDKSLEHIVLVHYRETQETQGSSATSVAKCSSATPVNSNSSSDPSNPSGWVLSEECNSVDERAYGASQHAHLEPNRDMTAKSHEQRLLEINTLEWDELLAPNDPNKPVTTQEVGGRASVGQQSQFEVNGYSLNDGSLSVSRGPIASLESFVGQVAGSDTVNFNPSNDTSFRSGDDQMTSNLQKNESGVMTVGAGDSFDSLNKDGLQTQDSFGRWINYFITDSAGSTDEMMTPESSVTVDQSYVMQQIFNITEISPSWALSSEETKILVIGHFPGGQSQLSKSNLLCVCADACFPAEFVQSGVYRCVISAQAPGLVNLYLSFDGSTPISQVMTFEFRAPSAPKWTAPLEDQSNWDEFRVQMRLAHLLFSTSKSLSIFSSKVHQDSLKNAKNFVRKCAHITDNWAYLIKSIEDRKVPFLHAKDCLFELSLQTKFHEWLLERVIHGCKTSERDEQGQGVIHLCAILGYTWAVYPFSWSGLSLDYRDKDGWTALHWAAHYGREKMVATLLAAGAKPNLVTDPNSENPGGCTAADLASKNGFEGLGAYLAEKGLVAHFEDMTLAGNVSGSLQTTTEPINPGNFTEEELYLKDTLAAYRTAADAAARIQTAFREHSFKVQTKAVESSNPEIEARNIVAAMKIQHAFRNYESRKKLAAAARIQYRFRTWKMRRDFLNMRRHAIQIQAVFRGFQVRRQYRKIVWSVGVLEKAVLRWRLKRKGFRGLQVQSSQEVDFKPDGDVEEDFFRASRKQAEERVERSVVRVQAMFRSKRAQEDYRRMKLEHNNATLEYDRLINPDILMG